MFKKVLAVVMVMVVMLSSSVTANAESVTPIAIGDLKTISNIATGIQPKYAYVSKCSTLLNVSSNQASCKVSVNGYSGTTTKIQITMTLQKNRGHRGAIKTHGQKQLMDISEAFREVHMLATEHIVLRQVLSHIVELKVKQ